MADRADGNDLISEVLAGRTRGIARMISRAETGHAKYRRDLAEIYRHTGRAQIVGITGVPGSGKSTLVREYVKAERARGRTVGVVAIDPSSPFSGGAILGDRVRMTEVSGDPGVFIRSMATRGALGGLARAALEAVDVLDAAGFELILIETVGVGQDEVDIARAAHTTVVVSAPGLGDDIQAIKAGILEIADIHVVSKCDKTEAEKTLAEISAMLRLGPEGAWAPPVIGTSAETGEGLEALMGAIDDHWAWLSESGEIAHRRRSIAERRTLKIAEEIVRDGFAARREQAGGVLPELERVLKREIDPHAAAEALLAALKEDIADD